VLLAFAGHAQQAGFTPAALIASPIAGAGGNREFLAQLRIGAEPNRDWARLVDAVVASPV
jgi:hypothetical protein